eukprot:UN05482
MMELNAIVTPTESEIYKNINDAFVKHQEQQHSQLGKAWIQAYDAKHGTKFWDHSRGFWKWLHNTFGVCWPLGSKIVFDGLESGFIP